MSPSIYAYNYSQQSYLAFIMASPSLALAAHLPSRMEISGGNIEAAAAPGAGRGGVRRDDVMRSPRNDGARII